MKRFLVLLTVFASLLITATQSRAVTHVGITHVGTAHVSGGGIAGVALSGEHRHSDSNGGSNGHEGASSDLVQHHHCNIIWYLGQETPAAQGCCEQSQVLPAAWQRMDSLSLPPPTKPPSA